MEYAAIKSLSEELKANIGRVIIGREKTVDLMLVALFCGGHVLLEDVPGTGKTTLAKALAKSLDCGFSRVQFTPDLLPSDVTGMRIYNQKTGSFDFVRGPVFTNVLLADEINRATPRTQSALLECMEEKQITEGGATYALEAPFLVIATQNPVESQGTFPLPEAQLDRFLMRLKMGHPSREESIQLMERFIRDNPLADLEPIADRKALAEAAKTCRQCHVSRDIMDYMAALCEKVGASDKVILGPSPRALLALLHACQAYAAIQGRDYVIPDDVKELAVPVLAHRLVVQRLGNGHNGAMIIADILDRLPAPTEDRA